MSVQILRSEGEAQTIELGEQFATQLQRGDLVVLHGDLGAGKTEFVKGVCRFLEVDDLVTSPTFSIINQYEGRLQDGSTVAIYHVDLYRIERPEELAEVGFDDMVFAHDAIKLVEWPEHAGTHLPEQYWSVTIQANEEDQGHDDLRTITIRRIQTQEIPTHEISTHENSLTTSSLPPIP
ncbi:MAG: tRNA (adenosine(37)-N6)-threonylcarbamoyltransferase complex ATPase subunit type 1 TsaE [Candidatus Kapaibacteriota bacterium]